MIKYNKIIIISESPFSKRDYLRFGVDCFIKNGFEVHLWDLNSILYPKVCHNIINDSIKFRNLKFFSKKKELLDEFVKLPKDCLIINYTGLCFNSLWIYRAITKYSLDYAVCNLGNIFPLNLKNQCLVKSTISLSGIIRFCKKLTMENIINQILRNMPKNFFKYLGIKPAKIFVAGSKKSIKSNEYYLDEKTHFCLAHSFDYDQYLEKQKIPLKYTSNEKYAVFIDQFFPFHSDFLYSGGKIASESAYYPALSRFFDQVTYRLGIEIIIAAHPRSYYDRLPDYFNGRKIKIGETEKLVQMSEFVIMHDSTAINYAVLYNKPIMFITSNEINKAPEGAHIKDLANLFSSDVINIDELADVDFPNLIKIDSEIYDQYINDYIKIEGTPEKPIWEIFIDEIIKCNLILKN